MPKRKKLPKISDYNNFPVNGKTVIQKSNPLQSLSETPLTLAELKILDVYLSRIDSHNPEKRCVRLEKGELENLLGVSRILKSDLDKRLDNLFVTVTIRDEDKPEGFVKIGLFEKAQAFSDSDGLWQVDLICTPSAMKYIFNIENLGYLRYRLKNIIDLTSRYSYVLYMYLENNRFRKSWEIDIDELKQILRCNADTYDQYYRFNDLILKKCHKELNEKTDLKFSYEPIKRGRTVVKVRFTIEKNTKKLKYDEPLKAPELPEELPVADTSTKQIPQQPSQEPEKLPVADTSTKQTTQQAPQEFEYQNDALEFLAEACGNEFNNKQMLVIFNIIATAKLEETGMGLEFDRYHFLSKKYSEMNYYSEKINILNRFSYFKRVIENSLRDNF